MTHIGVTARRLLSNYTLPYQGGRIIVGAVVVYAMNSGLYLAGSTLFFLRGIHLSAAQVGAGLTVAGLAGFLTTVPVCMLARRFGPLRLLQMIQVWRAGCFVGLAFATNFYTFVLFASLWWISQGPVLPTVQQVVAAVGGDGNQTRSLGVVGSISNLGMCIGALVAAPFLSIGGVWMFRCVLLIGGLCCLAASGVWGLLKDLVKVDPAAARTAPVAKRRRGVLLVSRDRGYLALTAISGLLFLHTVLLGVGIPLWLVHSTDASPGLLSALVIMNTVLAITFQVHFTGRIKSSRDGTRALRYAGISLAAFSLVLIASAHTRSWLTIMLLVLATVLLTAGELLQGAGSWELSYRHAPAALRTEYLSVFTLGSSAVGIVGPALVTLILSQGTNGLLILCGLFLALSAAVTALGRWLALPDDQHTEEPAPESAPEPVVTMEPT